MTTSVGATAGGAEGSERGTPLQLHNVSHDNTIRLITTDQIYLAPKETETEGPLVRLLFALLPPVGDDVAGGRRGIGDGCGFNAMLARKRERRAEMRSLKAWSEVVAAVNVCTDITKMCKPT